MHVVLDFLPRIHRTFPSVVARGAAKGCVGGSAHVDRNSRRRSGQHANRRKRIEFAFVFDHFAGPQFLEHFDLLVDVPSTLVKRLAAQPEFELLPTDAEPEVDASPRNDGRGTDRLRGGKRIAKRQDVDRRHETQVARLLGERRELDPGVGPRNRVLPGRDSVLGDRVGVDLGFGGHPMIA